MASPTENKGFTYPAHGGAVNAWDSPLNENFEQIDAILGDSYNIVIGSTIAGATFNSTYATISSTVTAATINSSLSQKLFFNITGTLTQDVTITYPDVGSFYVFNNETTGDFDVRIKTADAGSTSVAVEGKALVVTSDTNPYNIQPETTFGSGTRLLFPQAAPPAGWTQIVGTTDRMIRLVNDATGGGTGGSWTISGVTVDNFSLTINTIPSHDHEYTRYNSLPSVNGTSPANITDTWRQTQTLDVSNTGGSNSHGHGLTANGNWRPSYLNVCNASKD